MVRSLVSPMSKSHQNQKPLRQSQTKAVPLRNGWSILSQPLFHSSSTKKQFERLSPTTMPTSMQLSVYSLTNPLAHPPHPEATLPNLEAAVLREMQTAMMRMKFGDQTSAKIERFAQWIERRRWLRWRRRRNCRIWWPWRPCTFRFESIEFGVWG